MFTYIEKLRGKSERTKTLVAAGGAALLAGIIFVFWILSVFPNFQQEKEISDRVQSATPSPLGALSQILSQGISGIDDKLSALKSLGSGFFGATEIVNNSTTTLSAVALVATTSETNTTENIATTTTP